MDYVTMAFCMAIQEKNFKEILRKKQSSYSLKIFRFFSFFYLKKTAFYVYFFQMIVRWE